MERDAAVEALDATRVWLSRHLTELVYGVIEAGEVIPPEELSHRLLDNPLDLMSDDVTGIFDDLAASHGMAEDVANTRHAADIALSAVCDDLNLAPYEIIHEGLPRRRPPSPGRLTDILMETIHEQRHYLVHFIDMLLYASSSSGSEPDSEMSVDENGVILPLARRHT